MYQQNFQATSGPNGDVYFNVASPYNGITDGTGAGASFAGNSPLNGQIITSTSGISSGQGGSGNFLFDNMAGTASNYSSGMEIWGTQTNTTANLELTDLASNPTGNDFGVDTIALTGPAPLPELPVPLMLSLGLGIVALLRVTRRYHAV